MKTKPFHESIVDAVNDCESVESFITLLKLFISTTISENHIEIYKSIDVKVEHFAQLGIGIDKEILKQAGDKLSGELRLITQKTPSISESLQNAGFTILSEGIKH